jgi:hypothetical protein
MINLIKFNKIKTIPEFLVKITGDLRAHFYNRHLFVKKF